MPIRINLLAESQAADESRRKDPVKRGMSVAAILIVGMLLWGGFEYLMTRWAEAEQVKHENEWKQKEGAYKALASQQMERDKYKANLDALTRLATNRFLWGTTLNAFQDTTVPDVQFLRLASSQAYSTKQETITRNGKKYPGKATATEKVTIVVEAKDYGSVNEQNVEKLKRRIFENPYFKTNLISSDNIRLHTLNTQQALDVAGKPFTTFILECQFPERVRE